MPVLHITTNVDLEGIDIDLINTEASSAIGSILGRPQQMVMVVLNGSVPISFTGNKDPAILAKLISMGGINSIVKKKLITSLGAIFESHLSVPPERFFCHVIDTTAGQPRSKL